VAAAAQSVTIRIDQIKELKIPDIQSAFTQGESWLLCRKNASEGVVERHTLEYLTQTGVEGTVLKFWRLEKDQSSRAISRSTNSGSATSKPYSKSTDSTASKGGLLGQQKESRMSADLAPGFESSIASRVAESGSGAASPVSVDEPPSDEPPALAKITAAFRRDARARARE